MVNKYLKRKQNGGEAPVEPKKDSPYEKAVSFEVTREELFLASERKAWRYTVLLGVLSVILAIALMLLMPLKQTLPFVIKVNENNGDATVLSIANEEDIPYSEMMDKYWLNRYVLARETYDYRTLSQDFTVTRLLSFPNVFEPYAGQFGTNEHSLEQRLKDSKRILVDVISIVPNGKDVEGNNVATIRFVKKLIDTKNGQEEARNGWVATVAYEYVPDFKADEPSRLINPFGFKVSSYRVDPELLEGGGL